MQVEAKAGALHEKIQRLHIAHRLRVLVVLICVMHTQCHFGIKCVHDLNEQFQNEFGKHGWKNQRRSRAIVTFAHQAEKRLLSKRTWQKVGIMIIK